MKTFIDTYQSANEELCHFNKVKQVGFFATIKYMLGCCSIVGGHGVSY